MGRRPFVPLLLWAVLIAYLVVFQHQLKRSSPATHTDHFSTRRPVPEGNVMRFEIAPLAHLRRGERSQGTAFSIDGQSKWLTARHVVAPCLGRNFRGTIGSAAILDLRLSAQNDLALITTEPMRSDAIGFLRPDAAGGAGQPGYLIGYPNAAIAQVSVRRIGPGSARQGYAPFSQQSVSVWAEASRTPPGLYSLSGMSGAALMTRDGAVIGVLSAESLRRGRVLIARIDSFATQSTRPSNAHLVLAGNVTAMRRSSKLAAARGSIAAITCSGT